MTHPRPPLSIDAALARIAGQLPGDWTAAGQLCGCKADIVRAWGNPTRREEITLRRAIVLDVAYRKAGGIGAPLHDTYAEQLHLACAENFADEAEILRLGGAAALEAGQALAAVFALGRPGATAAEFMIALKEAPEAIDAFRALLPLLARRAGVAIVPTDPMPP